MKKSVLITICMLLSVLLHAQKTKTYNISGDSLTVNNMDCLRSNLNTDFFKYRNIKISKYYTIIDSVTLLNGRFVALVLSPLDQQDDEFTFPCKLVINRVLIIYDLRSKLINKAVAAINDRIILNKWDFLSDPYIPDLDLFKSGFSLMFTTGSRIRCDLKLFFVEEKGKFILSKYTVHYYTSDLKHSKNEVHSLKNGSKNEFDKINTMSLIRYPRW